MPDTQFTLRFEHAVPPAGHRAAERLQREVWDVLMDVFSEYLMGEGELWPYLREVTVGGRREGWWTVDDEALHFAFPTMDGARARSAAAFTHWSRLAAALRWRTLEKVADHSDARFVEPLDLVEVLENPDVLLATHDERTWLLETSDGPPRLLGDDGATRPIDALDDSAMEPLLERGRCQCRICGRLRPDPRFEEQWRADLNSGDRIAAQKAANFLLQTVAPSTQALTDLAGAADYASSYRHTRAMFDLGKRLGAERLDDLRDAIEQADDSGTRAALVACTAGLALEPAERTRVLMGYFSADAPAAETAIEFLGYGEVPAASRLDVAERATEQIGQRDDLDYAVALTLYNLYREEDYPPAVVKDALGELSRQSGEQADVARRALAWFDQR